MGNHLSEYMFQLLAVGGRVKPLFTFDDVEET